jgi:predicted nucleotidyltransferase component of viral defense system
MEYRMKLHEDINLFSATVRAASAHLNINLEFVEKDYWITLVLNRLAGSKYVNESVFKGGTSLSKGYNLIERFSEDVDIAIINSDGKSGNEIKTIIRTIEKEITLDLSELKIEGITSKGSKFRKSVFEYSATEKLNTNNWLIIEINSFANPFPFQKLVIKSMIFDFLTQTENEAFVENYDLKPFEINVLSKEQTLLEKLVSLIRNSYEEKSIESISGKIRHFYDLYYLMQDPNCLEFVASDSFKRQFEVILNHDREIFEQPTGWQTKSISKSILITDFQSTWRQLKEKYQPELSALAYRPIPSEKDVASCFEQLAKRIL